MTSLLPDHTINKIDVKKTSEESERKKFFFFDVTVKPLKNVTHFWLKITVIILLIICIIFTLLLVNYW